MSDFNAPIVELTPDVSLTLRERRAGAATLRREKARIATAANQEFLRQHPEWLVRFGDAATKRGIEGRCLSRRVSRRGI